MASIHAPRAANPVDAHVGSQIRTRRKYMKMSQENLGDQLGITFQQVQKYERGANRVGASRLWKIAQVLEVPIGFFFSGMNAEKLEMAEGEQEPFEADFSTSSEGRELMRNMTRISDKKIRKQILDLAKSLAEHED